MSMGFSRQEYWSGLPLPPPGDLLKPGSPTLQADCFPSEPPVKPYAKCKLVSYACEFGFCLYFDLYYLYIPCLTDVI